MEFLEGIWTSYYFKTGACGVVFFLFDSERVTLQLCTKPGSGFTIQVNLAGLRRSRAARPKSTISSVATVALKFSSTN